MNLASAVLEIAKSVYRVRVFHRFRNGGGWIGAERQTFVLSPHEEAVDDTDTRHHTSVPRRPVKALVYRRAAVNVAYHLSIPGSTIHQLASANAHGIQTRAGLIR